MKPIPTKNDLFKSNRERLKKLLPKNSLVIVNANDIMPTNADGAMGHHQNSDLFYLSGVLQEESILIIAPDAFEEKQREVLFLREPNEHLATWEGHKLTKEQAIKLSGIQNIKWLADFPTMFRQLMCEAEQVYLNSNEHQRAVVDVESRDARFIRDCQRRYPLHQYRRLAPLMHQLRVVKSPLEIELIQHACNLTGKGFLRVLRKVKPGINEAQIEADFAYEFIRGKGCFAYPPIIASGANNCILHYNTNDQPCKAGQLVLLDVAAGYGQYMSDLTRTIPASGRFTRRQKQVYNAVLRIFRQMRLNMKPGKTTKDLRTETEKLVEKECVDLGLLKPAQIRKQDPDNPAVKKYFMHGVSHPIGLDVHDVTYNHLKIQPGWMLTCEPAIYIKDEGFGVRLENTVVVGENGNTDLMAHIPIEADEIEALMRR
jgi:Xaa-Pro aminopeptidase